jgi:hypothetical protein
MNPEELKETAEHAHGKGEKGIGLTMAVVAVLLAVTTLLSHRSHTEEILLQGKASDKWNFYQAKHIRAYEFGVSAELATLLPNGKEVAIRHFKKSTDEECGKPIEKDCKSPLLKEDPSPILLQLSKEVSAGDRKDEKTEDAAAKSHDAEGEGAHAAGSAEKHEKSGKQSGPKEGAVKIQEQAREFEHERDLIQQRANYYDGSELFLEVSIVLCSISLLADDRLYWKLSFISTLLGVAISVSGTLLK